MFLVSLLVNIDIEKELIFYLIERIKVDGKDTRQNDWQKNKCLSNKLKMFK